MGFVNLNGRYDKNASVALPQPPTFATAAEISIKREVSETRHIRRDICLMNSAIFQNVCYITTGSKAIDAVSLDPSIKPLLSF